ncbi:MAG TPA: hypothetical protein PKU91_05985 [Phycisphaerales bacterium]|nr:hypothetical protein [Phycisphaerales bacterium]
MKRFNAACMVLWAGMVAASMGFFPPPGPVPHCFNVVAYNSIPGITDGSDCCDACTNGASKCVLGSIFTGCAATTVNIICQKGTWRKNPDGTCGCWGSTGYHTVAATEATGSGECP